MTDKETSQIIEQIYRVRKFEDELLCATPKNVMSLIDFFLICIYQMWWYITHVNYFFEGSICHIGKPQNHHVKEVAL